MTFQIKIMSLENRCNQGYWDNLEGNVNILSVLTIWSMILLLPKVHISCVKKVGWNF